jgi:hypothetical protein
VFEIDGMRERCWRNLTLISNAQRGRNRRAFTEEHVADVRVKTLQPRRVAVFARVACRKKVAVNPAGDIGEARPTSSPKELASCPWHQI